MAGETTIPMLPCCSINDQLAFYVAMGFEITYKQSRPNTYACVKYEDIDLHFFTMKGYDEPKNSYSSCFILVPDLAALHKVFTDSLRASLGKVPTAGIPRISKLNNSNYDKQLRFNVIDPGGNWIRFAQKNDYPAKPSTDAAPQAEGQTKLTRATQAADWVIEAEGDFAKAAQVMDKALANIADESSVHRVQAMVLRASIAIGLDDKSMARTLLDQMRSIPLTEADHDSLIDELERAANMEAMLA